MNRDPASPRASTEPASSPAPPFRRAILIDHRQGVVQADLEDDFHRFGVTLTHDGETIVGVEGRAGRFPWLTCAEAPGALVALIGARVSRDATAIFRLTDPRLQCTHLFELSALAIAEAARGEGQTLLEAEVEDLAEGGRTARVFRDGALAMEWRIENDIIVAPAAYAGRKPSDFNSRTIADAPPDLAPILLIMRRVAGLAMARRFDVDAFGSAAEMSRSPACFSLQPANAPRARRMTGSIRVWPDRATLAASVRRP